MSQRPAARVVGALVAVAAILLTVAPTTAGADVVASPFTATKTISRIHVEGGADQVVEQKSFTLSVDETTNLRGHQELDVSWTGAHPTGGIIADPNSGDAIEQEYPVVLLECRGVDAANAPAGQALSPNTCWTATSPERFQGTSTRFPPYRIDRYASAAEREAIADVPQPYPPDCSPQVVEHWVPFVAASGTVFPGGSGACGGMAPEAANVGGLALPSNTTYAATHLDGTGSAKFDVWTTEDNTSLGCSPTVPCSLVAVPILGVSCDVGAAGLPGADQPSPGPEADGADRECTRTGHFQPGQITPPNPFSDLSVSGALWWSASNWRNRVTVPLNFAPLADACDVVGGAEGIQIYGSELMTQAGLQWTPHFCLDPKLFRVKHVQTPEPQARTLLDNGGAEAVFASDVPDGGYKNPVVNAPVAFTGFAVTFTIDDAQGHELDTLRLTPRLLAKLLTESYPAEFGVQQEYQALARNPLNITRDPEFSALNPSVSKGVGASQSASTLLTLSSDSDVMAALTAYINNDAEARSWLDGQPDPWGMVVNRNYKGIVLPTASWQLLDTFQPPVYYASGVNPCLRDSPVAYLPLVAAPASRLSNIAQSMEFSIANSTTFCIQPIEGSSAGEKLVPLGRQTPGHRFMIGVSSLADAHRYDLATASLQTQSTATPGQAFTSAEGRSFVAPDDASLKATAQLLAPDANTRTWPIPYDKITSAAGATAYPGASVVYAEIPTKGLPTGDATEYAQFLRFAAAEGQTPGSANGQLPAGYLPLTDANGLGALAAYTKASADAVQAQQGDIPPIVPETAPDPTADGSASPYTPGDSFDASSPDESTDAGASQSSGGASTTTAGADAAASPTTAPIAAEGPQSLLGKTIAAISSMIGAILPVLVLWLLASGIAIGVIYLRGRRKAVLV